MQAPQETLSIRGEETSFLATVRPRGLVDGGHVLLAVAGPNRLVEAVGDGLGDGHAEVLGFGGLQHQARVLAGELEEKLVGKSDPIIISPFIWA